MAVFVFNTPHHTVVSVEGKRVLVYYCYLWPQTTRWFYGKGSLTVYYLVQRCRYTLRKTNRL